MRIKPLSHHLVVQFQRRVRGFASVSLGYKEYRVPSANENIVAITVDGLNQDYLDAAAEAGYMPHYTDILTRKELRGQNSLTTTAIPSLSLPNIVSTLCGMASKRTGVCGTHYYEPDTAEVVLIDDSSFLDCDTIFSALRKAEEDISLFAYTTKPDLIPFLEDSATLVTKRDKSSNLLELCCEQMAQAQRPTVAFVAVDDVTPLLHEPGTVAANEWLGGLDACLGRLDKMGVICGLTGSHGINTKTGYDGNPKVVFAESILIKHNIPNRTILPAAQPNERSHNSLSSFASVYLEDLDQRTEAMNLLRSLPGVYTVMNNREAARAFELPHDRIGDLVLIGDCSTTIGRTEEWHDLSQARNMRASGGLEEQIVPNFFNRPLIDEYARKVGKGRVRNYDLFDVLLNGVQHADL